MAQRLEQEGSFLSFRKRVLYLYLLYNRNCEDTLMFQRGVPTTYLVFKRKLRSKNEKLKCKLGEKLSSFVDSDQKPKGVVRIMLQPPETFPPRNTVI